MTEANWPYTRVETLDDLSDPSWKCPTGVCSCAEAEKPAEGYEFSIMLGLEGFAVFDHGHPAAPPIMRGSPVLEYRRRRDNYSDAGGLLPSSQREGARRWHGLGDSSAADLPHPKSSKHPNAENSVGHDGAQANRLDCANVLSKYCTGTISHALAIR